MKNDDQPSQQQCKICMRAKQFKARASGDLVMNSENMAIHADVCGPFQKKTEVGKRYILMMTTDGQRYTRVELLRERSEVWRHICNFIAWLE